MGQQRISLKELRTKLERTSHAKLINALNNSEVDAGIKRHIEAELDSRANRGTSLGFGESA